MDVSAVLSQTLAYTALLSRGRPQLSLLTRFVLASSALAVVVMGGVGYWFSLYISDRLLSNAAVEAAFFTDSFISPSLQTLEGGDHLSTETVASLDRLITAESAYSAMVGLRVWKGNEIVYSNRPEAAHRTYLPSSNHRRASAGAVAVGFATDDEIGHFTEYTGGPDLLEIYLPIRSNRTQDIIAVVEIYQTVAGISADIDSSTTRIWYIVSLATIALALTQFAVVNAGSRTIESQRRTLAYRVTELSNLLAENEVLRGRVHSATASLSEMNEQYLRSVSSDLHDGPIQLIGMSMMRLDALDELLRNTDKALVKTANDDIASIKDALRESVNEMRRISQDIVPPEVEAMSTSDLLRTVASRHERCSGKPVEVDVDRAPPALPRALKICMFRFAQEGLSNAYRHGGGNGQRLLGEADGRTVRLQVSDTGRGLRSIASVEGHPDGTGRGQGLLGLRHRVESLGGRFDISEMTGGGIQISAEFDLDQHHIVCSTDLHHG